MAASCLFRYIKPARAYMLTTCLLIASFGFGSWCETDISRFFTYIKLWPFWSGRRCQTEIFLFKATSQQPRLAWLQHSCKHLVANAFATIKLCLQIDFLTSWAVLKDLMPCAGLTLRQTENTRKIGSLHDKRLSVQFLWFTCWHGAEGHDLFGKHFSAKSSPDWFQQFGGYRRHVLTPMPWIQIFVPWANNRYVWQRL